MKYKKLAIPVALLVSSLVVADEASVSDVQEVTITAERRDSEYLDTMATRDFYTREELEHVDADHVSELLNRGAGINFHRGNGVEYLAAIRSPVLTGGAGAGSFLYLEDGIALRAAGFANVNGLAESFFEAAGAIELVKGPGSALYGSNAVHGLVNIGSPDPKTARDFLRLSGGSHGFSQLQLGQGLSAGENAFRADVFAARDDGWRSDSGFDQQKLKLQHLFKRDGIAHRTVLDVFNLDQNTAGFAQGDDAYRVAALAEGNSEPNAFRQWHSVRLHHRISALSQDGNGWVVTPYARSNEMEFRLHFLPGEALEKNGHDSVGLQASNYVTRANHRIIYGADAELTQGYLDVFQDNPDSMFIPVFPQGLHYDYEVEAQTVSVFAQDRIRLNDTASVELGLRGEYVYYDYDNKADVMVDGRIKRVADRTDEFFQLTPKVSFSLDLGKESLAFKLSRGERAPQTSDLYRLQINQEPGDAEVETIDAFEIQYAYQGDLSELQANLFVMRKDNFFFRDANGFNVSNGKTRHQGVELKLNRQLTESFSFIGDAAYTRHKYDFNNAASSISKGDDVDSAPRKLANIRLDYDGVRSRHSLELRYVGPYYMDASNQNRYPGHEVLVYRGSTFVADGVKLFWRVNNITNARYAERADFAFGNERYFPGERIAGFAGIDITL